MELNEEILSQAKTVPAFDAIEHARPDQPKLETAKLVLAMAGIPSPFVDNDEFIELIPQGTARIRSELAQDYSGLSGLFESPVVETDLYRPDSEYPGLLADLRRGTISAVDFMLRHPIERLNWSVESKKLSELSQHYGASELAHLPEPTASLWKQVDGIHTVIMADPYTEGLYHLGARKPGEQLDGYDYHADTGETVMHAGKHSEPINPEPFVKAYDTIKMLDIFDTTQCPIMELVMGDDGIVQYLQYKKTGHAENYDNYFEIEQPDPERGFLTDQVMGVTPPEGKEVSLVVNPELHEIDRGANMFTGMTYEMFIEGGPLIAQAAWRRSNIALIEQGLSFRDTHSSSTPMHGPNLSIATFGISIENGEFNRWLAYFEELSYMPINEPISVKVVSNGRIASVEGDWPSV